MQPLFRTAEELNARADLFQAPERSEDDNRGPFIVVHDGFYDDPDAIRAMALTKEFYQYGPPTADQVGEEKAARYSGQKQRWMASALLRHGGEEVAHPKPGFRHASPDVRERIGEILGERPDEATWDTMGDWWNGAFHVQYGGEAGRPSSIHHHYKEGDVTPRGWSGLVYLSPEAGPEHGTTIWRRKDTGLCVNTTMGRVSSHAYDEFELALRVENVYNRLILFREHVLHRAEIGFGSTLEDGRMSQTFFFQSAR
jgi:hypothetical protein